MQWQKSLKFWAIMPTAGWKSKLPCASIICRTDSVKRVPNPRKIPDHVRKSDLKGRVDLCDLPLVTIDGETARDFDDAVFAEKVGRNYRLVVAIADVSHYVRPDDAIDADAQERSTSVYFPRRMIPMLPENLSNGICSLNPDVERLCMVCDMVVTYAGNIKEYRFYPAVMRSHARLTYNQVWKWLSDGIGNPHKAQIDTLYKLFKILQKNVWRAARSSLKASKRKCFSTATAKSKNRARCPQRCP